ncbi:conserved protein of unknown function [Sterolibacterium denitrificans]|uniref:DUF2249 domain-containing protein n=1 Tax=Sterolibacterium denitrificans TaxID=157592 RepID=A0A7Z7HNH5_9PROT|nr:DUF2249 domain-containing protein [Sterolibacterium denitrificans]SMB21035.1 conserved protein of unknown function [Sterolibacterium denitrificans]
MSSQSVAEALDVRVFVPIERHRMLLGMFAELPVGESFCFINDHDPLPLYYEFRSIHGDVVGWDYLKRGGIDWQVRVTRLEASQGREFTDISTLMDLRKIAAGDRKHVVFHRYGMMEEGDTMELIATSEPDDILAIFKQKFAGQHVWTVRQDEAGNYVAHILKQAQQASREALRIVAEYDVRAHGPAERHDIFFGAFAGLQPGQAFVFINDHDPKPLYYQIEAESNIPFSWEYLESGPEVWRVRVAKTRECAGE